MMRIHLLAPFSTRAQEEPDLVHRAAQPRWLQAVQADAARVVHKGSSLGQIGPSRVGELSNLKAFPRYRCQRDILATRWSPLCHLK